MKLYKGNIFVITEAQFAVQSQVMYYKQPNCTERLRVDATIMRSFQTKPFSRFLPSPYAGRDRMPATLNWPRQSIGGGYQSSEMAAL